MTHWSGYYIEHRRCGNFATGKSESQWNDIDREYDLWIHCTVCDEWNEYPSRAHWFRRLSFDFMKENKS